MKHLTRTILLSICLYSAPVLAEKDIINDATTIASSAIQPLSMDYSYIESSPIDIALLGFSLHADSGSLQHALDVHVSILPYKGGTGMLSNMENVSGNGDGFRLLPNGKHFSEAKPALISLAYEPTRIPYGYKETDVYTYYCDDSENWHRLERIAIDTVAHIVTSATTHFTDFANAVIKIPEMPESKAYVPTDMQDLPDPDPLVGIPMIAVPQANNMGTAELSYPISLPPGRHGLQPNLDIHYSSAGGNGLLGVGWSIPQPAITVDTRWGVPRYNLSYETEAYLINGEPFLLHNAAGDPVPLPHMSSSFTPRSTRATRFYARDLRNQSKAVRHGQNPAHYWWSVTTTDGVTYYYGYDPYTHTIDENSILRTKEGNIGYWALTYVVDRYDNYMRYINDKYPGNEIVIQSIEYTGNHLQNLQPYYRVGFAYKSRQDKQLDARLGMLRNQNYVLCQIYVLLGNETVPITTYRLYYEQGEYSLYKSRLKSIAKVDGGITYSAECGDPIENAVLQLSDESWIDDEDVLYNEITHESISNEIKPGSLTQFSYTDAFESSALFGDSTTLVSSPVNFSSSRTEGWNAGGDVTVGIGYNPAMTTFSAGANYSYSRNKGGIESMMIDLNGDGLLDRLEVSDNSVKYHRQLNNHTFASPVTIQGLDVLSREISSSHTFGLQLDFAANLSYHPIISNSYTDIYFADINSDGLPDLITPEGVRMNLLNSNDIPVFSPIGDDVQGIEVEGNTCSKSITFDGHVDERLMCQLSYTCIDTLLLSDLQPSDDGEEEFIELPMDVDHPDPDVNGTADATDWDPLPIEEGHDAKHVAVAIDTVELQTYQEKPAPASHAQVKDSPKQTRSSVTWEEILGDYYHGDDYSFRLINDTIFVFQKEFECTKTSDEPNIDVVRVWVSDREETLHIKSKAFLIPDTTFSRTQARNADGVRLRIQWNKNVRRQDDRLKADTALMLYDHTIDADHYTPDSTDHYLSVKTGDVIFFRLSALDNRRFDDVDWEQSILSLSGDTLYNSAKNYLCSGEQSFVAPASGTARITLSCTNEDTTSVQLSATLDTTLILNRTLSAQSSLDTIFYTTVVDSARISFFADSISSEPQWSKVHILPSVEYWGNLIVDTAASGTTLPDTLHYSPDVHLQYTSFYPSDTCLYRRLFGPLHKGWGWFAYNDMDRDSVIPLHVLKNEEYMTADSAYAHAHAGAYHTDSIYTILNDSSLSAQERKSIADSYFSAVPIYDPLSEDKRWVSMRPDFPNNQYLAYGNTGTIGQRLQSVSRQLQEVRDSSIISETIEEYDSPIPTLHGDMQRITTIRKSTHSVQHSLSFGMSTPIGIGVSQNISFGSYNVTSDYMDLNGDGFPDFVGNSAIQYSQPWGGIGSLEGQMPASFSNSNNSIGLGFSASHPTQEHIPSNNAKDCKMAFGGFGGGLSGQKGTDVTQTTLTDINADGLPDIVDADQQQVKYNLGYSFTEEWYPISSLSVSASTHTNVSISLAGNANFAQIGDVIEKIGEMGDYSMAQYSISGGFSSSTSQNNSTVRLIDINGDGYKDLLSEDGSGNIQVQYYNGYTFGAAQTLNAQHIQKSYTANLGLNLGATAGFTLFIIPIKFCFGIQTSPWNVSSSYGTTEFMDVDGDGYLDQVIVDDALRVRYNKNGRRPINMLTEVVNPTGQIISIGYALSEPSVKHRKRTWNMVDVEDKIIPDLDASASHTYDFSYANPFYDNYERTDYGYANVHTEDNQTYVLQEEYENRWYINRGEKISDLLLDENHLPVIGHRHETRYYNSSDLPQTDVCNDVELHVGKNGYWTDYYETETTPQVVTRYEKIYDIHHNLIQYADYGDVAVGGDEWFQEIGYKATTSYNMISLPNFERISDGSNILRQSRVNYNSLGEPFQIIQDDIYRNITSITVPQYDAYGNLYKLRTPNNEYNEWSWRRFVYDNATKTHITRVYNQFSEIHDYDYDLRFGLRTYSLDPAGNKMNWRYDRMGRLIDIVAPNEVENNRPYSVHYIYRQPLHDFSPNSQNTLLYPHVTKVAADGALSTIDVTIYDARGQAYQRKSWRCVNAQHVWVTDGWRERDAWYRPYQTYDPYITNTTLHPLWEADITSMAPHATHYEYDALNRMTYCKHPDMTENRTTYHFADDVYLQKRLLTNNTDENGVVRHILRAPQGWTVETRNLMDNSSTQYDYNPIGELIGAVDADGYNTRYEYDMFGNKIYRNHPDAGETFWNYAPDGSLISVKTARMNGAGDAIHYNYYFDKLISIKYPRTPLNNVYYRYDVAGRMAYYEDGTGSTRLYYDRMGNVSLSERRILVPTENNVYTFRTRYTYDSFGRIQNIVYPDGDNVTYNYVVSSGELRDVSRSPLLGPSVPPVVTDLRYDEQGRNIYRLYGNNTWTTYQYEPLRNRLAHLRTISPYCELQDLNYDYDDVSNITYIKQTFPHCYGLGGPYEIGYKYDDQNRLTSAFSSPNPFDYDFQADYSLAGRLGHGFCGSISGAADKYAIYGYDKNQLTHQPRVIFDQRNNTHAQLFWDANGNLSQILNCKTDYARFHDWDDENRLRLVLDNTKAGFYGYDANGERVYKLTGTSDITHLNDYMSEASVTWDSVVLYPNPYVTITPNGYTKHYYANEERLATSIGAGGWCSVSPDAISSSLTSHETELLQEWNNIYKDDYPCEYPHETTPDLTINEDILGSALDDLQYTCPMRRLLTLEMDNKQDILWPVMHDFCNAGNIEKDIFYRHSDHLGSANWITDQDGHAVQYLHYLPYGQMLLNQQAAGYDEQYKFTGKERDAESGYDYFGARYYAPPLFHWTTVDPLVDNYLHITPYAYCNWNPVKFIDPDGREKKSFFSNAKDQTDHRHFARQYKDDNRLHIFSHGEKRGLSLENGNTKRGIPATEEGAQMLSDILTNGADASELWNDYLAGNNTEPLQVVFHGCNTASMAEAMSKEFPDAYFTGATEDNHSSGSVELGPYSTYKIFGIETNKKKSDGQWNTYKDGKLIRIDKNPSATPIKFDE